MKVLQYHIKSYKMLSNCFETIKASVFVHLIHVSSGSADENGRTPAQNTAIVQAFLMEAPVEMLHAEIGRRLGVYEDAQGQQSPICRCQNH